MNITLYYSGYLVSTPTQPCWKKRELANYCGCLFPLWNKQPDYYFNVEITISKATRATTYTYTNNHSSKHNNTHNNDNNKHINNEQHTKWEPRQHADPALLHEDEGPGLAGRGRRWQMNVKWFCYGYTIILLLCYVYYIVMFMLRFFVCFIFPPGGRMGGRRGPAEPRKSCEANWE